MNAELTAAIDAARAFVKKFEDDAGAYYRKYLGDHDGFTKHAADLDKDIHALEQLLADTEKSAKHAFQLEMACTGLTGGNTGIIDANKRALRLIEERIEAAKKSAPPPPATSSTPPNH